jgi:hypothetical protein
MKTIVLITSIIDPPKKPLSYISTRSIYTSDERFEQTKKTFQTIRQKIPNAKIFLVECSKMNQEQEKFMLENSDYFLNLYGDENIRKYMHSESKSLCEGTMTYQALQCIENNHIEYDNLIKISGRYWLSDNFDYNKNFNHDKVVVKYIGNDKNNVFTALFQLPRKMVEKFKIFLLSNLDKMKKCVGYELLFGIFVNNYENIPSTNIVIVDPIGLCGFLSVSNDFYNG